MQRAKIDRRSFLKLGAGAIGSSLALSSRCAYHTPYAVPVVTIPPPTKRVFVCSDVHIGLLEDGYDGEVWFTRALSDLTTIGPVDYGLTLGDIAHNGRSDEFFIYRAIRNASAVPQWYEVVGNHEYFNGEIQSYYSIVNPLKSYTIIDGNIVFFMLSDEEDSPVGNLSDATLVWFIDQLSKNQDKIIIVCTHQCVYGTIRDSTDSVRYIDPKDIIEEILSKYRIDLWLCGHQHYYPFASEDMYYNGETHFVNVSSMNHGYGTKMSQSVILDFHEGTKEIVALRRSHDLALFDSRFTVTVPVPFPIELSRTSQAVSF